MIEKMQLAEISNLIMIPCYDLLFETWGRRNQPPLSLKNANEELLEREMLRMTHHHRAARERGKAADSVSSFPYD